MNSIEAINISKKFKNNVVFKDLNFSAKKGEITAITGPSGRGKTTLLRCFVGLENVSSGIIKINGKALFEDGKGINLKEKEKILKDVSLVFQEYNLFPNLTVLENLKIVKDDDFKINKLLNEFGLSGKEKLYPYNLSGGQKQRLSIIRSFLTDPKIILFDEPTSALDGENREKIGNILINLKNSGITVVVVTHDEKFLEFLDGANVYRM